MHDISDLSHDGLPSAASLLKATALAISIGGVLLVTTILPAEYGIDPTGIGSRMGLTALSSANAAEEPSPVSISTPNMVATPVWKRAEPYRTDTLSLTLQPNEGAEIKAKMREGERFVFGWEAQGGSVNFDMHGEPPNAENEFTSYWKGVDKASGYGEFTAPFDGTHGWYWRNRSAGPVTVSVTTSGYYETLYKP